MVSYELRREEERGSGGMTSLLQHRVTETLPKDSWRAHSPKCTEAVPCTALAVDEETEGTKMKLHRPAAVIY